jgi:Na+/proline symporter
MLGVTKLANRLTTGLVIASLVIGAAMLMRVPTRTTLFGYPALAIVCFGIATTFGVILLGNIWLTDRRAGRARRRRT